MADQGGIPFLRWAGSKRQLLPKLSRYWNNKYSHYIEPFVGSGCLFFYLQPENAILGDINSDLIETYGQIKENLPNVLRSLRSLHFGKDEYLKLRAQDPKQINPADRASRFIYLNRYCFNGLYRTNKLGKFNVPFGGERSGQIPNDQVFCKCSHLLQKAELISGSFEITLEKVTSLDFVYIDPPFRVGGRRTFIEYDPSNFSYQNIISLREWLVKLDRMGAAFLLSYADSDEADLLKSGFYWEIATVRRSIAGFTSSRKHSQEVLISNVKPCMTEI